MSAAGYVYDEHLVYLILFGEKTCSVCGEKKPANSEHFHRDKTKDDGLAYACRECRVAANAATYRRRVSQGGES